MDAMEQSSTQTSDLVSSPHTTMARGAPLRNSDPYSFDLESLSIKPASSTKTKVQGLMPREEGQRRRASFNTATSSSSTGFFSYFLMLRLVRRISIMRFLQGVALDYSTRSE